MIVDKNKGRNKQPNQHVKPTSFCNTSLLFLQFTSPVSMQLNTIRLLAVCSSGMVGAACLWIEYIR
jgi:hypothetical protein